MVTGVDRTARALGGEILVPPVRGITFVDPSLLPGPRGTARRPAEALVHACSDLRLDFAFVPSWEPWAPEAVAGLRDAGVAALWVVNGVWWPTLERLGVEASLRMAARTPDELGEALEECVPGAIAAVEAGLVAGAAALVIADDLAGAAGPIASPALFAAQVFPRLARIAAPAAGLGVPAVLHSDGDMGRLLALVKDAGFVALHGDMGGPSRIEGALPTAREHGLALIGGLSASALTSPLAGAHEGARVATLAAGGGLLVSEDGGLSTPEQVAALFSALGAAARG